MIEEAILPAHSKIKETLSAYLTEIEHFMMAWVPVTVLGYHNVSDRGDLLDLPFDLFVRQIRFLQENFELVSLDDVVDFTLGRGALNEPAVALTFDDGYAGLEDAAIPFLEENRIPAAFFVLARPEVANRNELKNTKTIMSRDVIRSLRKKGWIIGCHSATHANLAHPDVSLDEEIARAKNSLQQEIGCEVRYFAYPKGRCPAEAVRRTREAGFAAAFTASPGIISTRTTIMKIPRVFPDARHTANQFAALFTYWGNLYLRTREVLRGNGDD